MKSLISVIAVLVIASLSACGGDTTTEVTPQEPPPQKEVIPPDGNRVTVTQLPCPGDNLDLVSGEVDRDLGCFSFESNVTVTVTSVQVAMTGAPSDDVITRVHLSASTGKGGEMAQVTEDTGFRGGKLVLRGEIELIPGKSVYAQLRGSVPYAYTGIPFGVSVGFRLESFALDPVKSVPGTVVSEGFSIQPRLMRYPEGLVVVKDYPDHDYLAGGRMILAAYRVVNPDRFDAFVDWAQVTMNGNFSTAAYFLGSCLSNVQVEYLTSDGVFQGASGKSVVESFNQFGLGAIVPAGRSIYVRMYADGQYCSAAEVGAYIDIMSMFSTRYPSLRAPEFWHGTPQADRLFVSFNQKG